MIVAPGQPIHAVNPSVPNPPSDLSARVLNLVDAGVIVLDADQRIVLWNNWLVPRSGRAASRMCGLRLFDAYPELRGSQVEGAVLAALAEGHSSTVSRAESPAPFALRTPGSFDGERLDQSVSVVAFKEGQQQFCLIEIRDVSGALERERRLLDHAESLRARSYVDGLTGIANRRYFDVALDRELRRAQRQNGQLSLLLVDIDSFKAYNDHFGHQQGDACITAVAQALADNLKRPADVAARYGGEEFAAILPDTSLEQAALHANLIREYVVALGLPHAPDACYPTVTLSVGVASFDKAGLNSVSAMIEAADKALYAAKHGGRNRVVAHRIGRDD
jgi:diguanylate cyclase (GGDEF)-like protein